MNSVPHRSPSQFNTYMGCGERYRLERRAKAPQQPTAWSIMGTAFHEVVESWERWGRQGTVEQAQQFYAETYDRLIDELTAKAGHDAVWLTGSKKSGEQDIAERLEKGAEYVRKYVETAAAEADEWQIATLSNEHGTTPALEVPFTIYRGGVKIVGFIDCVRQYADGALVAVDYKTGSKRPDTPLQLAVYASALRELYGIDPAAAWLMTKDAPDKWLHYEPLHNWDDDMLGSMFADMDAMEASGIYVPNPGSHCRTCPVADWCRIMGEERNFTQYPVTTNN